MDKYDIYMVGALDSLGVPYTADNKQMKSFIDMVADKYKEKGIKINYVNLCSLARNKTWELKEILDKDYTKEQYYKLNQNYSKMVTTNKSKNSRFNHPTNPDFVKVYYSNMDYADTKITTELKNAKNPIFLYTCGGMNFDYYTKCPSCDFRKIIPEFVLRAKKHLNKTMEDIDDCVKYILSLNPSVKMYVLGVYPMIDNRLKLIRYIVSPLYKIYNKKIVDICNKYDNVIYIDIYGTQNYISPYDNHPTYEGQKYIAKQIVKRLK